MSIDFTLSPELDDLRMRVRAFVEEVIKPEAEPYIFPDKRIHLQYTTTSPKLHKVLGVESPVFD